MVCRRPLAVVALSVLLLLPAAVRAQGQTEPFSPAAVERQILSPAYVDSLYAASWAAEQGPRAVPTLEKLAARSASLLKKAEREGSTLGAFPFNAVWALGRIPGPQAGAALARLAAGPNPEVRTMAAHALAAHKLRAAKGAGYGVYARGQTAELRAAPSESANVLRTLKPGAAVRILRENVENPKETGPRGGPTAFDYVEVLPSGPRGYVERAGDGFSPFY